MKIDIADSEMPVVRKTAVINYKNRLYRFGGYDARKGQSDVFAVSNFIGDDDNYNLTWKIKEEPCLPQGMWKFQNFISESDRLFQNLILTFGGKPNTAHQCIDVLYPLNPDHGIMEKTQYIFNLSGADCGKKLFLVFPKLASKQPWN